MSKQTDPECAFTSASGYARCGYCGGEHREADCDEIYTPIRDCEHKDAVDGTCHKPGWWSAECHVNACPRLNPKLVDAFDAYRATHNNRAETRPETTGQTN